MLHALREWLTAVTAVTLLLSLIRVLTPDGAARNAASFAGGLALAAVLLRPLGGGGVDLPAWDGAAYRAAVEAGEAETDRAWREALAEEVRRRTAEAVRRRMAELGTASAAGETEPGMPRTVEVETKDSGGVPLPWTVTLSGERDAGLEAWIGDALGIPPERQRWTGDSPAADQTGAGPAEGQTEGGAAGQTGDGRAEGRTDDSPPMG